MDALEAFGRNEIVDIVKKYVAGIGLSVVPIYLVADENAVLDPERMLATGIAGIIVPLFKLQELYFLYVLNPIFDYLANSTPLGVNAGEGIKKLPADYALIVSLLVNGALTALSSRIMEEEGLAPKILGAMGGLVASSTTWLILNATLLKEGDKTIVDYFPPGSS